MNIFKKIAALLTAAAVCFGLVGCHPKNEVALTIGGIDYTSSFYMCALLQADGEAKGRIQEAYKEKDEDADVTGIDYFKEKLDDKKFADWVKDRALEICRTYAYVETTCDEKNIKISSEDLETADSYADNYWNSYGYATYYGANGVSFDTFKEFFTYSSLLQTYFLSIYGKEGTEPIPEAEIKTALTERFALANSMTLSLKDEQGNALSEDKAAEAKTKLEGYKARLDKGEAFKTIYEEEKGQQTDNTSGEEKEKPQDTLAQVFGNEDTESYASDYYEDIAALKVGETKVIEDKENSQLLLVLKKDIMADPYYLNNMYDYIINLLKYDDYEDQMAEKSLELEFKENKFATNRFKVKKIKSGTEK